jgi:hypothetical protein
MTAKGITRKGAGVRIDVLACQKEIAAGTFSDQDKRTLDRMLPGVYDQLKSRAVEAAREGKAKL